MLFFSNIKGLHLQGKVYHVVRRQEYLAVHRRTNAALLLDQTGIVHQVNNISMESIILWN